MIILSRTNILMHTYMTCIYIKGHTMLSKTYNNVKLFKFPTDGGILPLIPVS